MTVAGAARTVTELVEAHAGCVERASETLALMSPSHVPMLAAARCRAELCAYVVDGLWSRSVDLTREFGLARVSLHLVNEALASVSRRRRRRDVAHLLLRRRRSTTVS